MARATQKRREIRELIHDAAIREFARNGLSGTSTQAIAESAGITKAQLHYYISSKEELYQDVLGGIVEQWKDIFFLSSSPGDPAQVITDYIDRKIRHALEYPDVSRLFGREMARGAPAMEGHWGELKNAVARASEVIQGWIDAGLMAPIDPLLFQINIWAVTQHYAEYEPQIRVLMGVEGAAPLDARRIIAEATALFLNRCGLGGAGSAGVRSINPMSIGAPIGSYSNGTVAGGVVVTSGQHGIARDGSVPDDVTGQAEICFSRIAAILAEQGLSFSHVLRLDAAVTRPEHVGRFEAVRDRILNDLDVKPSGSLLVVTALARPELLVEVEAVAIRPFEGLPA